MKVFIYKPQGTEFADDWLYAAYQGFTELGAHIVYFEDINSIPYAPDNIVVAFIEDTMKYLDLHGIEYPKPLNIPKSLDSTTFLGRYVCYTTFGEAKGWKYEELFIKPAEIVKQFPAGVIKTPKLQYLLEISDETEVMISEPINFISEWRCFVHDFTVVDLQCYAGKFHIFPKMEVILDMISHYHASKEDPISYSLDVGIVDQGAGEKTFLVEVNDFWSIGHYGLAPLMYAKMLRDRWFQLTGFRKWT